MWGALAGAVGGTALDIAAGDIKKGQQQSMMRYQQELQKDMANYMYDLDMKKWNDTNYLAQVEQMKKAGLNPALLYGQVGAGGMTSSNASNPSAPNPAETGGANLTGMNALADVQLKKAQTENLKQDTRAKNIDNDREEFIGDKRKRTEEDLRWKKADSELYQIFNNWDKDGLSRGDKMNLWNFETAEVENEIKKREGRISNETEEEQIGKIKYEYFNMKVENELKNAQINLTKEQERKLWHDIWQGWTKAGLQGLDMIIKGRLKDIGKGFNKK